MGDSEALISQLQWSNRRWKALALFACSALVFVVLGGILLTARNQMQAEAARREAEAARHQAEVALVRATQSVNAGQPR